MIETILTFLLIAVVAVYKLGKQGKQSLPTAGEEEVFPPISGEWVEVELPEPQEAAQETKPAAAPTLATALAEKSAPKHPFLTGKEGQRVTTAAPQTPRTLSRKATTQQHRDIPQFTTKGDARRAMIAAEIFQRKY